MERILCAGGGIGGLALAIAAHRQGLHATVLERSEAPVETGSGLVLSPNGMKAVAALGAEVAADVRRAGYASEPEHQSSFVTASGKVLSSMSFGDMEAAWGAPVVSLRRSRLHAVLSEHARRLGVVVLTGVAVDGFVEADESVSAGRATGDVLVGCDGLRSAVRRQLLGDGTPGYLGYSAVRGVGPAPERYPYGFLAYGRGLILFSAPVEDGQVYWVASISAPEGRWPAKEPRAAYADLLGLLHPWAPELTTCVRGSEAGEVLLTDIYDRDPVARWSAGRVTLLGDAAHPMAYTMGQGANLALEDAVTLAHHLSAEPTVGEAFAAYERARVDRTSKVVKMSRMMGRVGQARHPVTAWARDRMLAVMSRGGPEKQAKQNADLYGWLPPTGARPAETRAEK